MAKNSQRTQNRNNIVTNSTTLKKGPHKKKIKKKCDEVLCLLKHKKTQSTHFRENEKPDFLTGLLQGQNFMQNFPKYLWYSFSFCCCFSLAPFISSSCSWANISLIFSPEHGSSWDLILNILCSSA